jgi:hypothetical protein
MTFNALYNVLCNIVLVTKCSFKLFRTKFDGKFGQNMKLLRLLL